MENQYLSYLEEDQELYAAVKSALPALQRLSPDQIEKLVFYLKSLHHYYPKSENHNVYWSVFDDKLQGIRNSSEQLGLQRQASRARIKGVALCVMSGASLAVALAAFIGAQTGLSVVFLCIACACVFFADSNFFMKAIQVSKEQDRKYFLSSVRAANACNELNWAGLFSYNIATKDGALSDADLAHLNEQVAEITAKLRNALYNDEYFQYSKMTKYDR